MNSHKSPADREWEEILEKAAGAVVALFLCLYVVPQSFGAAVGVIAAGIHPWNIQGNDQRRHWRAVAGWSIAAGIALAAAYALLFTPLGADVELRRFQRNWNHGHLDPEAWVAHPWAWLPLASAVALIAYGGFVIWKANRR
jgi:hypothetical protein